MTSIPFNDLAAHHRDHRETFHACLDELLESSAFVGGKAIREFEADYAKFCDVDHVVGVGNGTEALYIALKSIGIGPGDKVVTVANTFIATTEAISATGAEFIFVDVDSQDHTMSIPKLTELLETHPERDAIRCLLPVHLYGQPARMTELNTLAEKYRLEVIADAAQSHGALYRGESHAKHAAISSYSFYPGKNLGALGDAGAIATNRKDLADYIRSYSNHGRQDKYRHQFEGMNSRLDTLQAMFLKRKLTCLAEKTKARQALAQRYNELLSAIDEVQHPVISDERPCVFHLYVIQLDNRDEVLENLKEKGIQCGIHYPEPLHLQPAYAYLGIEKGALPVTETSASRVLTLPLYPEMPIENVDVVVDALKSVLAS